MGDHGFGSFSVNGAGVNALGSLGAVVGWPLFIAMSLIASNALGWPSGEWKATPPQAPCYADTGVAILIAAIAVIALSGRDSA